MADSPHIPNCRECSCSNCQPNGTQALAERRDAWVTANRLLTDAAKDWPRGLDDEGKPAPVTFDAVDTLTLANWLYGGETPD